MPNHLAKNGGTELKRVIPIMRSLIPIKCEEREGAIITKGNALNCERVREEVGGREYMMVRWTRN